MSHSFVLARVTANGLEEKVAWNRHGDTVWLVRDGQKTILQPEQWQQAWADLEAQGFVEIRATYRPKWNEDKKRVISLIREAFRGVTLGEGVGLFQAQGLDNYAAEETLAAYRAKDEKQDWAAISAEHLDYCYSSPSFFDAAGMHFHLPAYLLADLEGSLQTANILFHLVHFDILGPEERFALLTDKQRQAVRAYLLLRLADANDEFADPKIEAALRDYWTAVPDARPPCPCSGSAGESVTNGEA